MIENRLQEASALWPANIPKARDYSSKHYRAEKAHPLSIS